MLINLSKKPERHNLSRLPEKLRRESKNKLISKEVKEREDQLNRELPKKEKPRHKPKQLPKLSRPRENDLATIVH